MISRIGLGLALAGAVLLAGCGGGRGEARHVLPKDVVPIHYDVAVRPNATALTFTGSVGADVEVVKATDTVTLNAADMTFGKHRLAIDYTGKINQQAFGLFSVDYDTPQGSKRLVATQFESPDARRFAPG